MQPLKRNEYIPRILKGLSFVLWHPLDGIALARAFLRGCLYIAYYRVFKPNVRIEWPFFVHQKIRILGSNIQISGPGRVSIGRFCSVWPNVFHGLSILTLSPTAEVFIGRHCSLGGLTIRCRKRVTIGEKTMTAYSLVQDCFFVHEARVKSRNPAQAELHAEQVSIGNNVWLGGETLILGGSTIGNDSVVSWGSTCYRTLVKDYCLVSGNPTQRPLPIPNVLRLKGSA